MTFSSLLLSAALLVQVPAGVPTGESPAAPAEETRPWFVPAPAAFEGAPARRKLDEPFDAVAGDMDGDGDADLLLNWHHYGFLELFENVDGSFECVPAARSGLLENRGIPELFATRRGMSGAFADGAASGLYVWHDPNRRRSWQFLWRPEPDAAAGLELRLETSVGVGQVEGLEPEEFERVDDRQLALHLRAGPAQRQWAVDTELVATQLKLSARCADERPTLFAGPQLVPLPGGELNVWHADPHGMAWVDVGGGPLPELFVTRGGIGGRLVPPHDPKTDHFFVSAADGAAGIYALAAPDIVPSGYGRGRRLEWVDIDNDGRPELSIGNRESPNTLFARDPATGTFRDRAPELQLDLGGADVGAWADLDHDGYQDFFFVEGEHIHVARNLAGRRFERIDGESLGLVFDTSASERERFVPTSLRLADFDADGQLDLWLLGQGARRESSLFLRAGAGFRDASASAGFAALRGHGVFTLLDADNDGFEDMASFGPSATLWRNVGGERLEPRPLLATDAEHIGDPDQIGAATSCDVDGDGRTDMVLLGAQRYLLMNAAAPGATFVDVILRGPGSADHPRPEPIGAIVSAVYDSGMVSARRYGSAHNTAYSQALQPLRFGVPAGRRLQSIRVRWPGATEEHEQPAPDGGRALIVTPPD